MKKKLLITVFLIVVSFTLIFTACGNNNDSVSNTTATEGQANSTDKSTKPVSDNEIIDEYLIAGGGDWGYPTPYAMIARGPGFTRLQLVFDSLIWKDKDGNFISEIAKDWEFDESTNTYTFTINNNIKWHDGKAFSVEDIVFTVNYMKEHKLPWMNLDIVTKVEATNESTIVFKLGKPFAPFLSNVAGSMPIIPKHIYENVEDPMTEKSMDLCVGCGPFKLKEYTMEEGNYIFEGFEDYYQGTPKVNLLKFVAISKEMQPAALQNGKLDLIMPSGDIVQGLKDADMNIDDTLGMYAKLMFNCTKAPFDNKEFRQAIAFSVDADEVISIAQRGFPYKGQTGFIPESNKYFCSDVEHYDVNLKKADQLLIGLGYEKIDGFYSKDGKTLELNLLGHDRVKRDVDVIAKQLNEIGIKTNPIYKDLTTCDQLLMDMKFDFSVVEGGASGDPLFLNREIVSQSVMSDKCKISAINKLLGEQVSASNDEVRAKILDNFQQTYADELPSYILYYSKFYAAFNDKLDVYFTNDGFGLGIPLPYNKMIFIK